MLVRDLLNQIRKPWLVDVSHKVSKGEQSRKYLLEELERFYDLLLQAVDSGDPSWLKPLLIDWSTSRTEADLDKTEVTISPVITGILSETNAVARKHLTPEEAVMLTEKLMPFFSYCFEQAAHHEAMIRIGFVSAKLDRVQRELERLDRSKSDFIAVAAHELKTPLTLIEGYAAMMRELITEEEEGSHNLLLLKGVDNGTRRLGEIIDDMIDVSMIDNNLLALNFQPTWLNRLFEVLQQELCHSVAERRQTLEIKAFEGSDEMTFADSERIYQALRNLLTNAIKYTPDGGMIVVDGRKITGFIEITVTDTGIGVNPEDQSLIFEKFGRLGDVALHSSGKTKFKGGGPGLGLPITKGILEAHGGTVWVESDGYDEEKLPGSVFHVLMPLLSEPPDDKVAKLFQSISGDNES